MHRFILALIFLAPIPHADITRIQETLPGMAGIPSNRGYIIDDSIPGFKQVTPTTNGVVDTSRTGYLIGPTKSRMPFNRMDLNPDGSIRYGYERTVE